MEQATVAGRTFRVERIEREHRQQGPFLLHGERGAVYGTMRFFANRERAYEPGEALFLINARTGSVDPLGSITVWETEDGIRAYGSS
jgi:hypothetical protein